MRMEEVKSGMRECGFCEGKGGSGRSGSEGVDVDVDEKTGKGRAAGEGIRRKVAVELVR